MNTEVKWVDIGVFVYPGAQLSAVYGLTDLFVTANRFGAERGHPGAATLRISHWCAPAGSAGIERSFTSGDGCPAQLDALIVPPSLEDQGTREPAAAAIDWINRQHKGGAVVCSVCAGAFTLARAGLLRGRPATTHWALKEQFSRAFPDVQIETDKLIIEDGDIITAGGVMAWTDLGLRIIDRFLSPSVMLDVARYFLVDPGRREQRFYSIFAPQLQHGDEAILAVQHWLQANCNHPVLLADMSSVAGMSERTFIRRFKKATTLGPTAYLQLLRVGKAREMLEFSSIPFNQIAWKVGYEDAGSFRKVFQKLMGLSPGDYRRRFSVR